MNWISNIKESLDIIEQNLMDKNLTSEKISKKLHIDSTNFQKIFRLLTCVTVKEYIRNRRLSNSALYLLNTNKSISDTALSFGYETPESFTKAFKRFHGYSPKEIKENKVSFKSYPPMVLKVEFVDYKPLDITIVEKDEFYIVGKVIDANLSEGKYSVLISKLWGGTFEYLSTLMKLPSFLDVVGASYATKEGINTYVVGARFSKHFYMKNFKTLRVKKRKWAIFTFNELGIYEVDKAFNRIYTEWIPYSGFKLVNAPELEIYPVINEKLEKIEIWLPVDFDCTRSYHSYESEL